MKNLMCILFVLTMTVFVACDKGDGGSGSNKGTCNNSAYANNSYGATPNSYGRGNGVNPAYQNTANIPGQPGFNVGCPTGSMYPQTMQVNSLNNSNGYVPQNLGCQGSTPIFQNQNQYCQWLSTAESMCNPQAVRNAFLQTCTAQQAQQLNYCQTQALALAGRTSYVDEYDKYDDFDDDYDSHPYHSSSAHSDHGNVVIYDAPVRSERPVQTAPKEKVVVDEVSHVQVIVKKANCHINISACRRIRPADGEKGTLALSLIGLDTTEKFMKEVARKNIQCWDMDTHSNMPYPEYALAYEQKHCPSDEPRVVEAPAPVETAKPGTFETVSNTEAKPLVAATTSPAYDTTPAKIEALAPSIPKGCLNIQAIHDLIANPSNQMDSYLSKLIALPNSKSLSVEDKKLLVQQAYVLPVGSTAQSLYTEGSERGSALGQRVIQTPTTLDIDDQHGIIAGCDSRGAELALRVNFTLIDPATNQPFSYKAKFTMADKKSKNIQGALRIDISGTANLSKSQPAFETSAIMIWDKDSHLQKGEGVDTAIKLLNKTAVVENRVFPKSFLSMENNTLDFLNAGSILPKKKGVRK